MIGQLELSLEELEEASLRARDDLKHVAPCAREIDERTNGRAGDRLLNPRRKFRNASIGRNELQSVARQLLAIRPMVVELLG